MRRRVDMNAGEVLRGDPEHLVVGRTEQRARTHAPPQAPKPYSEKKLLAEMRERRRVLRPAVREHARLEDALRRLEGI